MKKLIFFKKVKTEQANFVQLFSAIFWNISLKAVVMIWFGLAFCEITLFFFSFGQCLLSTIMSQAFYFVALIFWREAKIICIRGLFWCFQDHVYFSEPLFPFSSYPLNVCCLWFIQGDYDDGLEQYIIFFLNLRRCVHFMIGVLGQLSDWKSFFSSFPLHRDHFHP